MARATTIQGVITLFQTVEATITGVNVAYDNMPEALPSLPAFVNYPARGEFYTESEPNMVGVFTIVSELHVARGDLVQAETLARPFIYRFPNAIFGAATIYDGGVEAIERIRWVYGELQFAGETHLGIRFETDVRLRTSY